MSTPHITQKAPYPTELEAGKTYFWCLCGQSKAQPFCDGSHRGGDFAPMAFTAEKAGVAYLCGCKQTTNAPYCNGSHKSL